MFLHVYYTHYIIVQIYIYMYSLNIHSIPFHFITLHYIFYIYIYIHAYMYINTYIYICMYVCVCVCVCVYVYVYVYVYVCMYVYIYTQCICIYIYIHKWYCKIHHWFLHSGFKSGPIARLWDNISFLTINRQKHRPWFGLINRIESPKWTDKTLTYINNQSNDVSNLHSPSIPHFWSRNIRSI